MLGASFTVRVLEPAQRVFILYSAGISFCFLRKNVSSFFLKTKEEFFTMYNHTSIVRQSSGLKLGLASISLYQNARSVANLVFEHVGSPAGIDAQLWLEDCRELPHRLNPHYGQTENGLFLELLDDKPVRILMPPGRWEFAGNGGGDWGEVLPLLLRKLAAKQHRPAVQTRLGKVGPVYALHRVGQLNLPIPVERKEPFMSADYAFALWDALTEAHEKTPSKPVQLDLA